MCVKLAIIIDIEQRKQFYGCVNVISRRRHCLWLKPGKKGLHRATTAEQQLHEHTAIEPDFTFRCRLHGYFGCACLSERIVCRVFVNNFPSDAVRFVYLGIVVKAEFSLCRSYYILTRLYLFSSGRITPNLINGRATRNGWNTKRMAIQVMLFNSNNIMSF